MALVVPGEVILDSKFYLILAPAPGWGHSISFTAYSSWAKDLQCGAATCAFNVMSGTMACRAVIATACMMHDSPENCMR